MDGYGTIASGGSQDYSKWREPEQAEKLALKEPGAGTDSRQQAPRFRPPGIHQESTRNAWITSPSDLTMIHLACIEDLFWRSDTMVPSCGRQSLKEPDTDGSTKTQPRCRAAGTEVLFTQKSEVTLLFNIGLC